MHNQTINKPTNRWLDWHIGSLNCMRKKRIWKRKFMTLSPLSLLSIAQSFSTNLHQIWQVHNKKSAIFIIVEGFHYNWLDHWLLPCYFEIGRESQSKSTLQSLLEDRRSSRTLTGKDLNYLIVANWSGEKQFDLWVKFGTHSVCYSRPFHFIHTDGNWMAYFTWAL